MENRPKSNFPAILGITGTVLYAVFFVDFSNKITLSTSTGSGGTVKLSVAGDELQDSPEWDAGKSELPLSVNEAILLGIGSFHQAHPNRSDPFVQTVEIRSVTSSQYGTRRYYSVLLLPCVDGKPNYKEAYYEVLVLMNGTVIKPSKGGIRGMF